MVRVERVEREREWHDRRYGGPNPRLRVAKYYRGAQRSEQHYRSRTDVGNQRVLEYGCGTGSAAFDLASGNDVVGIDISPVAVERARVEAARLAADRARFLPMDAERTSFADESFDLVMGSGILHHLDLDQALAEVARVLRPGGRAVFREPLAANPAIALYRRLTPRMRTHDEHPLRWSDVDGARRWFETVEVHVFHLLSIAAAPIRALPGGRAVSDGLDRFDSWLFSRVPAARRLAWIVVLELSGPRPRVAGA